MNAARKPALVLAALFAMASCGGEAEPPSAPDTSLPPAPVSTTAPPANPNTPGCKLNLPKGTGPGVDCPRTQQKLLWLVEESVITVRDRNPSAYPLDGFGFRLTDQQLDAFFKDVVDYINASGHACAYRDGLELAVKTSNAESEQYKFWVTSGHMRLGENAYRATCTPAWF